ncbi:hypothetical protein [Caldisericum exile]|uniref:Uncharacterized protein n=1 Tax=Caldisericum exile (strain DSM 21853 / NBRC 104410 / AZM16c01) TaxID=511051 RepID=A0A7U6GFX0_CALEA|nr:hypothetical protein [Caldisericum exile]BAL81640.1 hypothetical protein CSE_15140 [Caldisericum exile AZM16c01]
MAKPRGISEFRFLLLLGVEGTLQTGAKEKALSTGKSLQDSKVV